MHFFDDDDDDDDFLAQDREATSFAHHAGGPLVPSAEWFAGLQGTLLDDKYELTRCLENDGFSAIFAAKHVVEGQDMKPVSVRLVVLSGDRPVRIEQLRDARALSKLHIEHLTPCIDVGTCSIDWTDVLYTVTTGYDATLFQRLLDGPMPVAEVRKTIYSAAAAMRYLRDRRPARTGRYLRPEHVLHEGAWKLWLFGQTTAPGERNRDESVGDTSNESPAYSDDGGPGDWEVRSLGLLAWTALTGIAAQRAYDFSPLPKPIPADEVSHLVRQADLPTPFDALVAGCLAAEPQDRWTTERVLEELSPQHGAIRFNNRWITTLPSLAEAMRSDEKHGTYRLQNDVGLLDRIRDMDDQIAWAIEMDKETFHENPRRLWFRTIVRCAPTLPLVLKGAGEITDAGSWITEAESCVLNHPSRLAELCNEWELTRLQDWLELKADPDPATAQAVGVLRDKLPKVENHVSSAEDYARRRVIFEELGYCLLPDRPFEVCAGEFARTADEIGWITYGAQEEWADTVPARYLESFQRWQSGSLYAWLRQRKSGDLALEAELAATQLRTTYCRECETGAFEVVLRVLAPNLPPVGVQVNADYLPAVAVVQYPSTRTFDLPYSTIGCGIPSGFLVLNSGAPGATFEPDYIDSRTGTIRISIDPKQVPASKTFEASINFNLTRSLRHALFAGGPASVRYAASFPSINLVWRTIVGAGLLSLYLAMTRGALWLVGVRETVRINPEDKIAADGSVYQIGFTAKQSMLGAVICCGALYLVATELVPSVWRRSVWSVLPDDDSPVTGAEKERIARQRAYDVEDYRRTIHFPVLFVVGAAPILMVLATLVSPGSVEHFSLCVLRAGDTLLLAGAVNLNPILMWAISGAVAGGTLGYNSICTHYGRNMTLWPPLIFAAVIAFCGKPSSNLATKPPSTAAHRPVSSPLPAAPKSPPHVVGLPHTTLADDELPAMNTAVPLDPDEAKDVNHGTLKITTLRRELRVYLLRMYVKPYRWVYYDCRSQYSYFFLTPGTYKLRMKSGRDKSIMFTIAVPEREVKEMGW